MYEPIRPVKNMISVARNSHMATLPGVAGAWWLVDRPWPAEAGVVETSACAIVLETPETKPRKKPSDPPRRRIGQAGIGFRTSNSKIAGRYTIEARSSRRAVASLTLDQNRAADPDSQTEDQRPEEVQRPGQPDDRRQQADRHQRQGVERRLAAGQRPRRIDAGKHPHAPPGVVVAVDPGDRQEVRELPEEDDQEQGPGLDAQLPRRRRPADHRRQRPGTAPTAVFKVVYGFSGV